MTALRALILAAVSFAGPCPFACSSNSQYQADTQAMAEMQVHSPACFSFRGLNYLKELHLHRDSRFVADQNCDGIPELLVVRKGSTKGSLDGTVYSGADGSILEVLQGDQIWRIRDRIDQQSRELAAAAPPMAWAFEPSSWGIQGQMLFHTVQRIPDQNGDGIPEVGIRFREAALEQQHAIAWCIALDGASGKKVSVARPRPPQCAVSEPRDVLGRQVVNSEESSALGTVSGSVALSIFNDSFCEVDPVSSTAPTHVKLAFASLTRWADLPGHAAQTQQLFEFVEQRRELTPEHSTFEFTDLPAGEYRLLVRWWVASDTDPSDASIAVCTKSITILPGRTVQLPDLQLDSSLRVTVNVTGASALAAAELGRFQSAGYAFLTGPFDEDLIVPPTRIPFYASVGHDSAIVGLSSGTWMLELHPIEPWDSDRTYARSLEFTRKALQIEASQHIEIDISAPTPPVPLQLDFKLTPQLVREAGSQLRFRILDRYSGELIYAGHCTSDDEGECSANISIAPGRYRVVVMSHYPLGNKEAELNVDFDFDHLDGPTVHEIPVRMTRRAQCVIESELPRDSIPNLWHVELLSFGPRAFARPQIQRVSFNPRTDRPRGPGFPAGTRLRLLGGTRESMVQMNGQLVIQVTAADLARRACWLRPTTVSKCGNSWESTDS